MGMIIKSYQDLCGEIQCLEWRMRDLEREYYFWYRQCLNYGKKAAAPLDICVERMKGICDQVEAYATELERKQQLKRDIEHRLSQLEGLEGKVMYKRVIEGKSLREISLELDYSYDWIKKISSRGKKYMEAG